MPLKISWESVINMHMKQRVFSYDVTEIGGIYCYACYIYVF